MTPEQISSNWKAENGVIRPVNTDPNGKHEVYGWSPDRAWSESFTYPCPTLTDGPYEGKDLDWYETWDGMSEYDKSIRLKSTPAPAIEKPKCSTCGEIAESKSARAMVCSNFIHRQYATPAIDAGERVEDLAESEFLRIVTEDTHPEYIEISGGVRNIIDEGKLYQFIQGAKFGHAHALKGHVRVDEVEKIKANTPPENALKSYDTFSENAAHQSGFLIGCEWKEAQLSQQTASLEERVKELENVLSLTIELYGIEGGPWNIPSSPGSWIDLAKQALNPKQQQNGIE